MPDLGEVATCKQRFGGAGQEFRLAPRRDAKSYQGGSKQQEVGIHCREQ